MSTTQIQVGGIRTPALATVATDQITIGGSGSQTDPLHALAGGTIIPVTLQDAVIGSIRKGMPMMIVSDPPDPGTRVTVNKGSGVSTQGAATILGIAIDIGDESFKVQTSGIVTLTAAEWDLVAGTSGGLAPGDTYFVDTLGTLSAVAPGTPGAWSSQVGLAFSATELFLCCPSVPIVVA